jgi:hypothetical protein
LDIGPVIVQTLIKESCELLELLFGPCDGWDSEGQVFDVSGAQDIIGSFFKHPFDPFVISKGINQCMIPSEVSEQIDKLLGSLEAQQTICGNGTMLTLGGSVIQSRMELPETKKVSESN